MFLLVSSISFAFSAISILFFLYESVEFWTIFEIYVKWLDYSVGEEFIIDVYKIKEPRDKKIC